MIGDGDLIAARSNAEEAITRIRRNIQTIQAYKQFPAQLYQMVHIYDMYITEVIEFVNEFAIQLTSWMQTNANRYSQYVDTLILMR